MRSRGRGRLGAAAALVVAVGWDVLGLPLRLLLEEGGVMSLSGWAEGLGGGGVTAHHVSGERPG
jgi:hypothetical protein